MATGREAVDEALRAVREGQPYRLALLDWKMPELDGLEAAARISATPEIGRLPVVLVTAYEREFAGSEAAARAVDAVLHKPVSPSTLHDTVVGLLARPERRHRTGEVPLPRLAAGKRLLLVEDNEINRQVAREFLQYAGVNVVEAHNGYQALDRLARESFDAVLMDVQMPELDGVETVKAIRSQEHLRSLPVIAMTAHAMLGDRERFLEAGMSDYISKPIEEKDLLRVLARWVGEPAVTLPSSPEAGPVQLLPGLNTVDGVRRASGNADLYRRLLREFDSELPDTVARIRRKLETGAREDALALLHTLKGGAATLGARRIAEEAAAIEAALRRGEDVRTVAIDEAVEEVRRSIAVALDTPRPEHDAAQTAFAAPGSALLPIARRLEQQLRENNLGAVESFHELKTAAGPWFLQPMLAVESSLDRLDFDAARAHLRSPRSMR